MPGPMPPAIPLPRMLTVQQRFDDGCLADPVGELQRALNGLPQAVQEQLRGKRICVGLGSRGIQGLQALAMETVRWLRAQGAEPFIVPAMGSHGGAIEEGQVAVLHGYGITADSMGVPILADMHSEQAGSLKDGTPVFIARDALTADGILVLNKCKPHSDFRGPHESGVVKMLALGLGKREGAAALHAGGFDGFSARIQEAAEAVMRRLPLVMAIGVAENARGRLCALRAAAGEGIFPMDAALLCIARSHMASIMVRDIDLLIIDEIGKDISGNGFDPNIVGRAHSPGFDNALRVKRLFIRGLSAQSCGNAAGLSLADITTRRCIAQVDVSPTRVNALAAGLPQDAKLPPWAESDELAIRQMLHSCPDIDPHDPRVVRIRSTAALTRIEVSEAFLAELTGADTLDILDVPATMAFDAEGGLPPLMA